MNEKEDLFKKIFGDRKKIFFIKTIIILLLLLIIGLNISDIYMRWKYLEYFVFSFLMWGFVLLLEYLIIV